MKQKRILVYGAGVIGSIYAGKLSLAGYDVTMLARNKRLNELKENGLRIKDNNTNKSNVITIKTCAELLPDDVYDFVFVTLHKEQVKHILPTLQKNHSGTIVFMVNTAGGYKEWTTALGENRVLPAFPGAGGMLIDGVVNYQITAKMVQPTTIGEIGGITTARLKELRVILETSGFPVDVSRNMDAWQKTHIALMAPLLNVVYYDGKNNYSVAKNPAAIVQMTLALKEAFGFIKKSGIGIEPLPLNFLVYCPSFILNSMMKLVYNTKWAETVISTPALATPDDYERMSEDFVEMAASMNFDLVEMKKLMVYHKN
jgi:2-dehydropantoate 2-reductase